MKETITDNDNFFNYGPPPARGAKVILLTVGRVAMIGKWGDGNGVIGWRPLPKRDKKEEERLGLL